MNDNVIPFLPLSARQAATPAQRVAAAIARKRTELFTHDQFDWIDSWFDWYMEYCKSYTHALTEIEMQEMHEYFRYSADRGVTGHWPSTTFTIDGKYEGGAPRTMISMRRAHTEQIAAFNVPTAEEQCQDLLHALRKWRYQSGGSNLVHSDMLEAIIWRCGRLGMFSSNWADIKERVTQLLSDGTGTSFVLTMREPGTSVQYTLTLDLTAARVTE